MFGIFSKSDSESKKFSLLPQSILEVRIDFESIKPNNTKIYQNRFWF